MDLYVSRNLTGYYTVNNCFAFESSEKKFSRNYQLLFMKLMLKMPRTRIVQRTIQRMPWKTRNRKITVQVIK